MITKEGLELWEGKKNVRMYKLKVNVIDCPTSHEFLKSCSVVEAKFIT